MHATNPFELFSPIHPAWLYRRHELKLDVTKADLDAIESNWPSAVDDPLFADYRRRSDAGTLRRRPGRKPLTTAGWLRRWAARFAIEDEVAEILARRRAGALRARGDRAPCLQAAELVSREFRFNITPEALHNMLSRGGYR
jgi:hypothetical protein